MGPKSFCYAQFLSKAVYSFNQTFVRTIVNAGHLWSAKTDLVSALRADSLCRILSMQDGTMNI